MKKVIQFSNHKPKGIRIGQGERGPVEIDVEELIYSKMVVQGNSGAGKSWLVRLICEHTASLVPIIVLDPEGEYASLREKHDLVLVGREGEIATDVRTASLLARKLIELSVSAVIDLFDLRPLHRREYVKLFLESLIDLPRSLWRPTLVCVDEAHSVLMFCSSVLVPFFVQNKKASRKAGNFNHQGAAFAKRLCLS